MKSLLFFAATTCVAANLAISTYFKDGFTPTAIAADPQGAIYIAGSAIIDPAAQTNGAMVAKIDPKATQYLYLTFLDSAANDQVTAIAVDSAGNAYVAGSTTNPNFPVVGASSLGTPPTGAKDSRSFVAKLNPQGSVVFSVLIGGSISSSARGVAITPQGQLLISGIANAKGFPTTAGAFSIADSTNHWFLMELDATASNVIFSATGIGGSSIALDSAGNIYMAGSSVGTDYPTTPGAYQTTFAQGHFCFFLCQIGFNGNLQHVTKVDAAASKLIYSTGINDPKGLAGSTTNTGLAIDGAGNAYVTGTLFQAAYPFTVTPPQRFSGFLSKLDAAGANLLFSIPVGGGGVQLDHSGALYIGGTVTAFDPIAVSSTQPLAPPAIFSAIPQQCWPNNIVAISEAYVMKVDSTSGTVQDAQWIDGSAPTAVAIVLSNGKVWITGATPGPDVPFTPGVLAPRQFSSKFVAGAYLSAVDFSVSSNTGPSVACVVDAGNMTHVGAVAAFQLLTIFGSNLASANGAAITFDGNPAQLLYVSPSQINVAVPAPLPSRDPAPLPTATVMQLTVDNTSVTRQFPFTVSNLNLFADLSSNEVPCPSANFIANGFQPLAVNADGSLNSCTSPAHYGSTVSMFVHGVGAVQLGFPPAPQLLNLQAFVGFCSEPVVSAKLITGFVYKVDIALPPTLLPCAESYSLTQSENSFPVFLSYNNEPVGPFIVPVPPNSPIINFSPGQPMPMIVWVTK